MAQEAVQLSSTVELPRLVDLASQRLGLNIEYDTKLTGTVTLRLGEGVTNDELWALVNRLLASRGFTTVRMVQDDTLSVVPLANAADLARVERGTSADPFPPGFRCARVSVKNRKLDDIAAAVKPLLSAQGGRVTALPGTTEILIADLAERVQTALELTAELDAAHPGATVHEVPLTFLSAKELVALVAQVQAKQAAAGAPAIPGELLPAPDDRSVLLIAAEADISRWERLLGQLDRREPVVTRTYTPQSFPVNEVAASIQQIVGSGLEQADPGFRVLADELTASILVTATSKQHEQIEELLGRLAEAPAATRRPTRTFRLMNRDAEEVLGVVQSLLAAGVLGPSTGSAATAAEGTATPASSPQGRNTSATAISADGLQLASDPATNSIIAVGEAQELQRLEQLLRDLDVRRPQVLLEVLIISLSESDAMDLGVEIEAAINGPNDTVAKLASLFGLSSTGAGSSGIEGNRGAGFTGIVLNPGDFSVVLRALKNLNEGRSLSMPKVLVASNEQASINSVLEQPYTTINASDTVATTSFGGSSNAGTEVSVTPQIAEGDHLRLEYQVSLSAFVGEAADPSVPPPRQQNSIDSVATIPDGYTIAVGGIELTAEGYAETGIPLLSDVPILGEAFKNRSKSSSRSRFYVFIRPTILRDRDFEDLKYLSDRDVADTGIDDGWPVPEPRLIR